MTRLILAAALAAVSLTAAAPSVAGEHCEPRDPNCHHQGEETTKEQCYFVRTGAPANPATFGASAGAQYLELNCPGHLLTGVEYGYKGCRFPIGSLECTKDDPIVVDLGQSPTTDGKCSWKNTWFIYAPNINVFTFYFKATTQKDANCDGAADDWNGHVVSSDGTSKCYWQNYFGAKPWENQNGLYWPYSAPPFAPTPDGKITECDNQIYETQWRGWN